MLLLWKILYIEKKYFNIACQYLDIMDEYLLFNIHFSPCSIHFFFLYKKFNWTLWNEKIFEKFSTLFKSEPVEIHRLSTKLDPLKEVKEGHGKSVKCHPPFHWKSTDLTAKTIDFTDWLEKMNRPTIKNSKKQTHTDETEKLQITDSISKNLTDTDLESSTDSIVNFYITDINNILIHTNTFFFKRNNSNSVLKYCQY